jgi:hypothetical protein
VTLREEVVKLQGEKDKLSEVAAEAQRGTAKGRSYEEEVAAAIDALALPLGDDCSAVGDVKESMGKIGDVVVAIGACHGPPQGRIVFEAKNSRLSRPEAVRQLDEARRERNADYAVLVVPSEEKVPARMHALREYNGDKLSSPTTPTRPAGAPGGLRWRARVLMARGDAENVDGAAVADSVSALAELEEVRRIRQQPTGAKTQIDRAS